MNPDTNDLELSVSDFVALLNQSLEYAFPGVIVIGELANLRVSKNRWVYFDLKDENCTVKFFGTVYQLPGPLEDGMLLRVRGIPKLHNLYGFSVNVLSMQPAGEGTIKRASELLQAKLVAEGLFAVERKRAIPYPPSRIGLITSRQSAAYADFMKILQARWQGIQIELIDVQVQGEPAPEQISAAIRHFNELADPPEVLVLIRGGGSAEDLAAFSTELVTRSVAASRLPTVVAIGHEVDTSLAELAADLRASTPSNAAELLTPDRGYALTDLQNSVERLYGLMVNRFAFAGTSLEQQHQQLHQASSNAIDDAVQGLIAQQRLLQALSPTAILARGYAVVRADGRVVRHGVKLKLGSEVNVQISDGAFAATVTNIQKG